MPELSIPLDDMAELITRTRAIQGREAEVIPIPGSIRATIRLSTQYRRRRTI